MTLCELAIGYICCHTYIALGLINKEMYECWTFPCYRHISCAYKDYFGLHGLVVHLEQSAHRVCVQARRQLFTAGGGGPERLIAEGAEGTDFSTSLESRARHF